MHWAYGFLWAAPDGLMLITVTVSAVARLATASERIITVSSFDIRQARPGVVGRRAGERGTRYSLARKRDMMKLPVVARFCVKFGRQMRQVMPLGRPRRVAMDNMSE